MTLNCNPSIKGDSGSGRARSRFDDPSLGNVRAAFQNAGEVDDWFVTLQRDETYLQCAGVDPDAVRVEYREDGTQYRSKKRLPVDRVERIFETFYRGNDAWKEETEWRTLAGSSRTDRTRSRLHSGERSTPGSLGDFFNQGTGRYVWLVAVALALAALVVYFTAP